MMLNGATFQAKRAIHYQDWGTVHEWRSELERRRVFMVSIDGFLFQRGSRYFKPAFADVQPNSHAVETVQKMGQQQQTIIYLSIRPPQLEELTRSQLKQHNLPDGQIIFGCGVAQWSLITAPHPSLPFATSQSFEIDPEDTAIEDKINLLG
jgi:hypothetical protein